MIDRSHALPIAKQAKALKISRSSAYYLPRLVSAADLAVMRQMDELHLDYPFAGSRMLRDLLNAEGLEIGRRHVATLMKRMGIEAIYRKPNTSKPAPGHKIYPYLLRKMQVVRPDQVWAMDITYIPMARGFVYLASIGSAAGFSAIGCRLRWKPTSASRLWKKLSPAMAGRRSSTPIKAPSSPARPSRLFFSKLASPSAWTARARGATMSSSNGFGDPSNTRRCISEPTSQWRRLAPRFAKRPHSSLDRQIPDQAYFNQLPQIAAA
jgi:putative transposase